MTKIALFNIICWKNANKLSFVWITMKIQWEKNAIVSVVHDLILSSGVLLSTKVRHFFFDRLVLEKFFDGKLRFGKDFPKL